MLQELSGATPTDLVAWAWTESPVDDEHAYLQLVGGCIHFDGQEDGSIASLISNIERHVPDRALGRLPSLTTIDHDKEIVVIGQHKDLYGGNDFRHVGTEVILGPIAEKLQELGAGDIHPKALADATSQMMSTGEVSRIESIFRNTTSRTRTGQGQDRTKDDHPADTEDGPRAIVLTKGGRVEAVQQAGKSTSAGVGPRFDAEGAPSPSAKNTSPSAKTQWPSHRAKPLPRLRSMLLEEARVEDLLARSPSGGYPRISVPTKLRGLIIEWRPILSEAEPLMALLQLVLFSFRRDEDYTFRQDCTNMPVVHTRIFGAFGMRPQTGWNQGINSAMLLEFYRRLVDPCFDTTDYHPTKGKARVIKSHGIPDTIIHKTKKLMLSLDDHENWSYLISGRSANRKKWTRQTRQERLDVIEDHEPAIEPPEATKEIQSYLNGLDQQTFGHGNHGIFRGSQIDKAIEVARQLPEEQRRDQELRKLYWMRKHPQPLYLPCDRFPRQKADRCNQAMNLPGEIRRAMYIGRDREVDLLKAHLASYVPVAKREGLDVPTLERYLEADLNGDASLLKRGDLWYDLASCMDLDGPIGKQRTAVKKSYSLVYGQDEKNLWYNLLREWGKLTGDYKDSTEPFTGLNDHPLMEELLTTRDKLEMIINQRGSLRDAEGRCIPLDAWDETKDEDKRWRGVMAYVNCTFEQQIMYPIFREARKEMESDSYTQFKVWLYQSDGVTIRIDRRVSNHPKVVARLQDAVAEKAEELGVPTELEVDWPEA